MRILAASVLVSLALSSVLFADAVCEQTLDRSMALTDTCLRELSVYKGGGKSDESQLLERLRAENSILSQENKKLRKELGGKNKKGHKAKKTKKKKKNKDSGGYKNYGKQLAERYRGVSDSKLLERGMYRVKTIHLNVRSNADSNADIMAVASKGEVYPFSTIQSKVEQDGTTRYWLKGDMGYMFITDGGAPDVAKVLQKKAKPMAVQPQINNKKDNPTKSGGVVKR